jgi:hypothetical protein
MDADDGGQMGVVLGMMASAEEVVKKEVMLAWWS